MGRSSDSGRILKQPAKNHRKLVLTLMVVAVGMFGFGYAMLPLYDAFCEWTGLGGRGVQVATEEAAQAVSERTVKIRFDATVNSALPWEFQPSEPMTRVQLGEMNETAYLAVNISDEPVDGHAIYTVTPPEASLYFVKTECFCFTQQKLEPHESRQMPVRFYVKPELPEHIREMTLSYTFFRSNENAKVALSEPARSDQE
jgi:cytochrome c oxidase assembly protein subunit 11